MKLVEVYDIHGMAHTFSTDILVRADEMDHGDYEITLQKGKPIILLKDEWDRVTSLLMERHERNTKYSEELLAVRKREIALAERQYRSIEEKTKSEVRRKRDNND